MLAISLVLLAISQNVYTLQEYCTSERDCEVNNRQARYILYDVNPPEGFNLRRDVYLRFAVFSHKLKQSQDERLNSFKLVLPPWSYLYHWKHNDKPEHVPWSYYFDMNSLQSFAPVIDMHTFFDEIGIKYGKIKIDQVYVLQHFESMFESGRFEDKYEVEPCTKPVHISYFYYNNVTSNIVNCLSFHGHVSQLRKLLKDSNAKSVLIVHAEVGLHDNFGDKLYWEARRSMRFNKELVEIANKFRRKYLNSTDKSDGTIRPKDWKQEMKERHAKGGPYLAIHLRRKDFVQSKSEEVPTIKFAAKQIAENLEHLHLNVVFIATDASRKEIELLQSLLDYTIVTYQPNEKMLGKYKDGGAAIIDQIICSHARHFVGTHESTFSFRIQEEREIMGFPVDSTFNRLCGTNSLCESPAKWTIV